MSEYGDRLFDQHAKLLRSSAIPVDLARQRGYTTVDTKARLIELGFSAAQSAVPDLLIPLLDVDSNNIGFQYRPDVPRERDGKPVKYETPHGQTNRLDVPPSVGERIRDPAVELWITEGTRKADAAAAVGLACVSLSGVWNWRGKNDKGGKVALPDWHDFAMNGRMVVLAFDSDSATKISVAAALVALADYLVSKGATVRVCSLPDDVDGKTGLDDYLAAGHGVDDLRALVQDRHRPAGNHARADGGGRTSIATMLVVMARRDYRLGINTAGEPFAVPLAAPHVVRLLRGTQQGLRATLAYNFHMTTGKVAPAQALTEALVTLEGAAQQETPVPLHMRVAAHNDQIYLDLGDPTGRAVQITDAGWRVVDKAPVLFRRNALIAPLPEPVAGASLDELWTLLNVKAADRSLVIAFLVAALTPTMPHPMLALQGEQGAARAPP